jgi:type II secretory pathway pseudopilin PulG
MKRSWKRQQQGSSIIELVIVVLMVMILSGMAIMATSNPSQSSRANAATDALVDSLRQARQLAITKRRNVLVTLSGTNQIQLAVQTLPNDPPATAIAPVLLNDGAAGGLQFYLFGALPNTPMAALGFGNNSDIDLEPVNGGAVGSGIMFTTSGGLVGSGAAAPANYYAVGNNDPINATIFIGVPGSTVTARAVTIVGSTGQVRPYYWGGTAWQE